MSGDRTLLTWPLQIHLVTFDGEGKLVQVRQNWDQGSLLKQLDVIGKSGRNWPIRDSKDQISLITRCVKPAAGIDSASAPAEVVNRSRTNSTNIMRDPHASLTLFAPREEVEAAKAESVVSPYAGNRPRQRSFTEILGEEGDEETSPSRGRDRSQSPSKAIAPKIGAGKNFQPIRLFDVVDEEVQPEAPKVGSGKNFQPIRLFDGVEEAQQETPETSPEKYVRPDPRKYQHFDFADGSDPQDMLKPVEAPQKTNNKHGASWSFDDFVTPQKPPARALHKARDVRHWGTENDVVEESPEWKPPVVKARRDAEAHFEFVDDGPDPTEPRPAGRPRGAAHNTGLGLYENNLYNEDGSIPTPGPPPLGNITNLGGRRKDFDAHFAVTDESPSNGNGNGSAAPVDTKISDDRKKAVRMMESNWDAYDESPAQKENSNPNSRKAVDERGIAIGGDGMGGKKGTNRDWLFGDDIGKPIRPVPTKQPRGGKSDNVWDF